MKLDNTYDCTRLTQLLEELKGSILDLRRMQDERVPLSDSIAPFGFVIVRHVNSKVTDYYWKECYTCIRKWYTDPILIIDDNSSKEFLNDNMKLDNCTIVYDTEYAGCGELLGYYYFHKLKPFESAVILHDSVFIQKRVDFSLNAENMRFLWTFAGHWDQQLEGYYHELCATMPVYNQLMETYYTRAFRGCFGIMSVIKWEFLDLLEKDGLFLALPRIKGRRDARSALERIIGFMAFRLDPTIRMQYGEIHSYIRWGTTFTEYLLQGVDLDIVKVWTGR